LAAVLAAAEAEVTKEDGLFPSREYPEVTCDMERGEDWEGAFGLCEDKTPVMAERVLGVIVPATEERDVGPLLFIMARKAAVLGEGGGKETGPPMSGVSPVPGVNPVRGVSPVRKAAGSKAGMGCSDCCWGPVSIAGDNGPDLSELERDADENAQE